MKVTSIQMNSIDDKEDNLKSALELAEAAVTAGADSCRPVHKSWHGG